MNSSKIQPILNESALIINNKALVVADLHIGIEKELIEKGINVTSQTKRLTDRLITLCEKFKPKEIILLGDIKHNIPSSTIQERKDVKIFLENLQSYGLIHIIPGNHDGNIKKIAPRDIIIHKSDGFIYENLGLLHGNRWPNKDLMQCTQILIGHSHPTIMFTDRLGYKIFEQCWIKSKFIAKKLEEKYPNSKNPEILIMPAFNQLCGGNAVNKEGIIGPLGKVININDAQIFLLDGTFIGKLKDIE